MAALKRHLRDSKVWRDQWEASNTRPPVTGWRKHLAEWGGMGIWVFIFGGAYLWRGYLDEARDEGIDDPTRYLSGCDVAVGEVEKTSAGGGNKAPPQDASGQSGCPLKIG